MPKAIMETSKGTINLELFDRDVTESRALNARIDCDETQ